MLDTADDPRLWFLLLLNIHTVDIVQFVAETLLFSFIISLFSCIIAKSSLCSSHPLLCKATTMGPRSLPRSPTWYSLTWWIRCFLMKTTVARFPGNAPPQSVRWTGRTARSPRRKTMMRGLRWSMDCPVSKCQSRECHVK